MEHSEELTELFKGMFALKGKLKQPKFDANVDYKDKSGRNIKFEYATLKAVIDSITTAAQESASGIDFQQEVKTGDKTVSVTTKITHTSGQWIEHGALEFPTGGARPQDMGGLITYAKRYSLSAAFGIAADKDDDAREREPEKPQQEPQQNEAQRLQEINNTINKYKSFLASNGRDMDELERYILNSEKVQKIEMLNPVKVMGYYKAFVNKQQTANAEREKEKQANKPVMWGQK